MPIRAAGSRTATGVSPISEMNGTTKYAYNAGRQSSYARNSRGKGYPYSSVPVLRIEYALYPMETSSSERLGGTLPRCHSRSAAAIIRIMRLILCDGEILLVMLILPVSLQFFR